MSADPVVSTVAVAPTMTTILTLDVRRIGLATIHLRNLDATQTLEAYVQRNVAQGLPLAASSLPDFSALQPAGSVDAAGNPTDAAVCDVDVGGCATIALVGRMSGAGGNVQVAVRFTGPKS